MYNDYTKKINGDGVNRSIYIVLSEIIHEWNKQGCFIQISYLTIRLSEKCCLNEFSCYFGMLQIDDT
jgi:hypothetical protein